MRVAILMAGDSIVGGGGAERRFVRLFQYLQRDNIDLHLIINSNLYKSLIDSGIISRKCKGVHVYRDKKTCNIFNLFLYNLWAIRTLKNLSPDLLHLPLVQKSLLPLYLWLYVYPKMRVVNTVALSWFASKGNIPFETLMLARFLWYRSNAIDSLYPGFQTAYGRSYKDKIFISPGSFTDPYKFYPVWPKCKRIVFAGRLIPEKNPILLLQALAILNFQSPEILNGWEVLILGKGPLESVIKNMLTSKGLQRLVSVKAVGCIEELLRCSRIFVSLQETENYPSQSLLEAMAAGNAVIATNVGETKRLVTEQTGITIPPGNPMALANALKELILDEAKCRRFGISARSLILQKHCIEHFADYIKGVWHYAAEC